MQIIEKYHNFHNQEQTLMVISTGGTIEKTYDEVEGSLSNRETVIKDEILDKMRYPYLKFVVKAIMAKDSLDLDDQDREAIYQALRKFEQLGNPMVVLHGTDTMDQTLKLLHEKAKTDGAFKVPIVFTGSMRPLGFERSDARQNVVESIISAMLLPPGVYLSFHGQLFIPPQIRKNKDKKTFEKWEQQ